MPVPSELSELLDDLESARLDVAARAADRAAKDQAAQQAAAAAASALTDLDASKEHMATDLAATVAKLQAIYGGGAATTTTQP